MNKLTAEYQTTHLRDESKTAANRVDGPTEFLR